MKIFNNVADLSNNLDKYSASSAIAFVPTMGGLHAGHLSLVELAKESADIVVVSIFVNPTQFGENEDFSKYANNNALDKDKSLLMDYNVDVLFIPTIEQIYPAGFDKNTKKMGEIANILCGKSRPGHFAGVVQVVSRLFAIIKPNIAIFGQKDYQQLLVIKQLARQLQQKVRIISHPTVREDSGLAMSTRNLYLSASGVLLAPNLYKILLAAKCLYLQTHDANKTLDNAKKQLRKYFKVDYIEILDANTLMKINDNSTEIIILSAVYIKSTRLIDNIKFRS